MPGKIEKSCSEADKHDGDIICVTYNNDHVFTGGADGKIKIWDKDLNLKKILDIHDSSYIYAIAVNDKGKLYSSSCDGVVRFILNPLNSDESKILMKCEDTIQCLYCLNDVLYTGDDKGSVTQWENDRIIFQYNLVEEVKSLAVEKQFLYTVRDLDVVVTEQCTGKSGKYSTRMTIPGKSPLALIGPFTEEYEKRMYLVFCTRDGKGMTLVDNMPGKSFKKIWNKEDCHEMIINSVCGTNESLFSGAYDGFVKMWKNIGIDPVLVGEINLGSCVNYICNGPNETVYSATGDGFVRRIGFC